jgi:hypothetical protein
MRIPANTMSIQTKTGRVAKVNGHLVNNKLRAMNLPETQRWAIYNLIESAAKQAFADGYKAAAKEPQESAKVLGQTNEQTLITIHNQFNF